MAKTLRGESSGPLILHIKGEEWDMDRVDAFVAQIRPSYDHPDVIIDMSNVRYVDATVLGAFAMKRKIRAASGFSPSRLVLTPGVRKIFHIVQFDDVWPIFDTLAAALET